MKIAAFFTCCLIIISNFSVVSAAGSDRSVEEQAVYEWFCKAQRDNGLLESVENVDMCGLYQMALTAMVFTLYGDYSRAEKVLDFYNSKLKEEFIGTSASERGFISFHHADGTPYYDTNRWMADNAWLLMAINYHRSATGSRKYDEMAGAIAGWIEDLQDKEGKEYFRQNDLGIWGGFRGEGTATGRFIEYKSTEGCIEAYAALYPYKSKNKLRQEIKRWIDSMYVPREKRLKIGTTVNSTDSELQERAYLAFLDSSRYPLSRIEKNFKLKVKSEETGKNITGIAYTQEDYLKGRLKIAPTLGAILVYHLSGDKKKGDYYLTEIEKALRESRVYPGTMGMPVVANKMQYLYNPNDVYNVSAYPSAWYLFAKRGFNPFQQFR